MPDAGSWSDDIFEAMRKRNIDTVATVPDAGLTRILNKTDETPGMNVVTLTTEEEGVAVVTGLWLGGRRGLLAMQSSGVGNTINALGLPLAYRAPCLMLVTMRGQWGEFNSWQVPMGQATPAVLAAMGVKVFPVSEPAMAGETFAAAADLAFNGRFSAAVLIGQRVIGTKTFETGDAK